jgi:hypothetical protein
MMMDLSFFQHDRCAPARLFPSLFARPAIVVDQGKQVRRSIGGPPRLTRNRKLTT